MEWVLAISALLGAVSFGAVVTDYYGRKHTTQEARTARAFNRRADCYQAVSYYLARTQKQVELTEPLWGRGEEPPRIEPDEEWLRLAASVAVTASDAVQDKLREVVTRQQAFSYGVDMYRRSQLPGFAPEPSDEPPGIHMYRARGEVIAAIETAQRAMRDELDAM